MRKALLLPLALAGLLVSSCAPIAANANGSNGSSGAANGYALTAEACWGARGGGGTSGFWLYNWGDGTVTVRNDLSVIVYPDGSEHQAISEMDLRRYRETRTFQQTVRIGPKQQGMFGMVSADAIRYDERIEGWVYSSPPGSYLILVADTPGGRVHYDTRTC